MKLICNKTGIEMRVQDTSGYTGTSYTHPIATNRNAQVVTSLNAEGLAGVILAEGIKKGYFVVAKNPASMRVANVAIQKAVALNELRRFANGLLISKSTNTPLLTLEGLDAESEATIASVVGSFKGFFYQHGSDSLRRERREAATASWADGLASEEVEAARLARIEAAKKVRRMDEDKARKVLARAVSNLPAPIKSQVRPLLPASYEPFYKESLGEVRPILDDLIETGSSGAGTILGYWEELTIRPKAVTSKGKKLPKPLNLSGALEGLDL